MLTSQIISLNQKNNLGQSLYLKTIPKQQTLSDSDEQILVTFEGLQEKKENLQKLLDEVQADIDAMVALGDNLSSGK